MVESVIVAAWALAAWRACRGLHFIAIVAAIAIGYVVAAGTLAALSGLDRAMPALHGFVVIFIGPRASDASEGGFLPLPKLLLSCPILARIVNATIALTVLRVCSRENYALNPLSPRSRMLDEISGPFLLLAILEILLVVQLLLVGALAGD